VSGWKWDKLSSYQEPRDSLYNFFFVDWMPHGEFELRHSLRPTTPGHYPHRLGRVAEHVFARRDLRFRAAWSSKSPGEHQRRTNLKIGPS